jgi:hypothetical protein
MQRGTCFALAVGLALSCATAHAEPSVERSPGPLPALDWNRTVLCGRIGDRHVRFQCDAATRTCRVAEDRELDAAGQPTAVTLSRAAEWCTETSTLDRDYPGYRWVQAVAEAPPGWVRDERNRVMQFNFDMHRRIWIGGGYAPLSIAGGRWRSSGEAEFGTRIDFPSSEGDALERLHLLEGRLDPGQGYFAATALTFDTSRVYPTPPIRISTFFGKPRRLDLNLAVGLYAETARVEVFSDGPAQTWIRVAAVQPTLDLWRSADLESYLRLRAGPSLDHDSLSDRFVFGAEAAADYEHILDRDGFHRLYLTAEATRLWGLPDRGPVSRLQGKAGYELILLAVNDQPLSLDLEGRGGWRDDVASLPAKWEWGGYAGLRFSFWAPARTHAQVVREAR